MDIIKEEFKRISGQHEIYQDGLGRLGHDGPVHISHLEGIIQKVYDMVDKFEIRSVIMNDADQRAHDEKVRFIKTIKQNIINIIREESNK